MTQQLHTLQSLVTWLQTLGDREGLVQLERAGLTRWSWAEVTGTAHRLARGLLEAGLQRGEFVPILATNRPEWVVAALAVISAGAAVSPLDTQVTTPALERILPNSQARFIFTTTDYLHRLEQLNLELPLRPILFDVAPDDPRGWRVLLSDGSAPLPQVEPDEPAALFYTSGTTGAPKGVPLTHHNLVYQLKAIQATGLVKSTDRLMLPLPMYHVYPFTVGILAPLSFGVPIIMPHSLTGPQVLRALREGEATIMIGVPRLYRAMYSGIEAQITGRGAIVAGIFRTGLKLSMGLRRRFGWQLGQTLFRPLRRRAAPQLRLLTSGGSALDPELAWKLDGFGWDIGIGYGLTETSPILAMNLPTPAAPKLASVGPPLEGIEIRIAPVAHIDAAGPAPTNSNTPPEGEIQARGPSVFSGYHRLPAESATAFSEDGWFRSGDLGYRDEAGYIYVTGRVSTLIVLEGGKKIQPEALEEKYQENQFIREIGILYQGNQLVALIVPEIEAVNRLHNGDVDQAIREGVNERSQVVASYQRLTDYAITEEPLPRTNLGKIRRHLLVERYNQARQGIDVTDQSGMGPVPLADMTEQDQALLQQPAARAVWDWLAERYPDKRLSPDTSPQLDLGVDSLEWLSLTLQVNDLTGVELDDETIQQVTTVRDLLQAVQAVPERDAAPVTEIENPEERLSAEQRAWLEPPGRLLEWLGAIIFFIYRPLVRFLFRVKVNGLENLPGDSNYLLTPNHSSMLDAPVLAAALTYPQMRQTHWAGAADIMLTNPLMRLVSRIARVLPIERYTGGTGVQNLILAIAALQRRRNLVWFPEGRISTTGDMLPFREGIGLILEQAQTAVVPVLIQGTGEAMPPFSSFPTFFKPVTITFGRPCDPQELARQGEGDNSAGRIAQALREQLIALRDQ